MYLPEQLLLAPVLEVVDRQPRHDDIGCSDYGQRASEIVLVQLDPRVAVESFSRPVEHRRRGVEPCRLGVRIAAADQGQEPTVAGAEIDEPLDLLRERPKQHFLGDVPVRDLSPEILGDPTMVRPLVRHGITLFELAGGSRGLQTLQSAADEIRLCIGVGLAVVDEALGEIVLQGRVFPRQLRACPKPIPKRELVPEALRSTRG